MKIKLIFLLSIVSINLCAQTTINVSSLKKDAPSTTTVSFDKVKTQWPSEAIVFLKGADEKEFDSYSLSIGAQKITRQKEKKKLMFDLTKLGVVPPDAYPKTFNIDISKGTDVIGKIVVEFIKPKDNSEKEDDKNGNLTKSKYSTLRDFVVNELASKFVYDKKRNLLHDENIIHVFLDEKGNFLYGGIPTTATQDNTYQFHIVTFKENAEFKINVDGAFKPSKLEIFDSSEGATTPNAYTGEPDVPNLWDFEIEGPFTDEAKIKIYDTSDPKNPIMDQKISIAKLYHVSIATGLLATSLRNPTGIEKIALPGGATGDSTLVANDPTGRGIVSVMATYYPNGRSFLLPPSGDIFSLERLGVVVGAQLNDKLQENFLLGLSTDFARGGSISFGVHYGRRNYVAGYDNFKFGSDHFNGKLVVKQEWALGFFIGVTIDTRVALKLFNLGDPK